MFSIYMGKWSPVLLSNEVSDFQNAFTSAAGSDGLQEELEKLGLRNIAYTGFVPNPLLENAAELYILAFAFFMCLFCGVLKKDNLLRVSKGIKTSAIVVFAVPLFTSSLTNIINFFLVFKFDAFSIISLIFSFYLLCYIYLEVFSFIWNQHASTRFFNSERGVIDFDVHPDSDVLGLTRRIEFFISLFLPTLIYIFSKIPVGASVIVVVAQLLLSLFTLIQIFMNNWRLDITLINIIKLLNYLVRTVHCSILVIYWIMYFANDGTPLIVNTILSYAYAFFMLLDVSLVIVSILLRFFFEA